MKTRPWHDERGRARHNASRLDDLCKIVAECLDHLDDAAERAGIQRQVCGLTGRAGLLEAFAQRVQTYFHGDVVKSFAEEVDLAALDLSKGPQFSITNGKRYR